MEITKKMIEKAKAVAEDAWLDYEKFAVRVQDVPFELGALDHVSHVWVDGEDTGEELDGVSGTDVDQLRPTTAFTGYYPGKYAAVIAGNSHVWGEDDGEIVIADPVVIYIF